MLHFDLFPKQPRGALQAATPNPHALDSSITSRTGIRITLTSENLQENSSITIKGRSSPQTQLKKHLSSTGDNIFVTVVHRRCSGFSRPVKFSYVNDLYSLMRPHAALVSSAKGWGDP